ncbi:MAG TPA: helix-turn-helix domain-containing protein [Pyrinomonadaceae bacterium]
MKRTPPQTDRIFVRPSQYTLRYSNAAHARVDLEATADFRFLFVLDGELRRNAPGEAPAHTLLFLAPGDTLRASGVGRVEHVTLLLAPAFVLDCAVRARMTRDDALITFRERAVSSDERLTRVARDIAEELLRDDAPGRDLLFASLVEQALVEVLRRYANIQRSADVELSRAGLVDRRIRRAVELMHAHLDRDLPLEELAGAAYLSPFHFSRLFKKLTGAAPHAYLASLRNARAQTLLAETDLSVTEVAERVGYSSSSHFSKAFRQATGLSPRAFRNALVRA